MPRRFIITLPTDPLLDQGSGFPILLMPGNTLAFASWSAVIEKLSRAYRILIPRLPFHDYPLPTTRQKDLVNYLKQFIYINLLNRVIIISSGTGAESALHFAAKFPDKVYKLVVIGPFQQPHNQEGCLLTGPTASSTQYSLTHERRIKNLFFELYSHSYPALLMLSDHSFSSTIPQEFAYQLYASSPAKNPKDLLVPIQEFLLENNSKSTYIL